MTSHHGSSSDNICMDVAECNSGHRQLLACLRQAMSAGGVLLKTSMTKSGSRPGRLCHADSATTQGDRLIRKSISIRMGRVMLQLLVMAIVTTLPELAGSQSTSFSGDSSGIAASETSRKHEKYGLSYVRPTQKTMVSNYVFDAFGPYPIAGSAFAGGLGQLSNAPPEWNQGVPGYSRRFGSDFGILAVGTTTRYALSQALREDSLYYRCDCKGLLPRLRHALLSTLTARRGEDGHRVFSVPALVAPYAGSFTAVYGWYPDRFGAKDAFRIGNYSLLSYAGGNIALEFLYSGPHSLLTRMHLNNAHGAADPGPNH